MKKIIIAIIFMVGAVTVYAAGENERATSVGYVAEELETRQDKFNKLGADTAMTYSGTTDGAVGTRTITGDLGAETNTSATTLPTVGGVNTKVANKQDELDFAANTVLMNTGVAGAPAAKGIYDDSGSYADQQSSLIEASTFNAALQNAINSEFTCAQRKDPNDPNSKCLLFNIFSPVNPSRNLFDSDRLLQADGWTKSNGVYTGSVANLYDLYIKRGNYFFNDKDVFQSNTQYTLSYTMSGISEGMARSRFFFLYTDNTYSQPPLSDMVSYGETKYVVLTSDPGKTVKGIFASYGYGGTISISDVQLEEGTVATPYQPYGQNTFIPQNVVQ